ncbi:MAG: formate--tetrahydrofolate ligase, partial [Gemmatimonadales bacterium]
PLYDAARPIKEKIETIAREIYGAGGVDYTSAAEKNIAQCESMGLGQTPVCIAKTQYSFSDDPAKLGRPTGFRLTIRDVYPSAGAGFVVALAGDIMTMPGLPKVPAAESIRVLPDGTIEGLF